MPQPAPRLIDRLGNVAAQLRGQSGDQHRVLLIGLIEVRSSLRRDHEVSIGCTHTNGMPAVGGQLPQHPPPVPGRLARHRHPPASPSPRHARRPSPAPRPDPRPGTGTSCGRSPSSRDRSPRPSACASARSIPTIAFVTGTSARSRSSRALRLRSPRDTPLPLPMNVLLLRGTPSPKRIRGTFLRHEPTRRTSFYAAQRAWAGGQAGSTSARFSNPRGTTGLWLLPPGRPAADTAVAARPKSNPST